MQRLWQTLAKNPLPSSSEAIRTEAIFKTILHNRGLAEPEAIEAFLDPPWPQNLDPKALGLNPVELNKAIKRINQAINQNEQVVIFGDYDCDGICATAILWEALSGLHPNTWPYLPHRTEDGFGLSEKSLANIKQQYPQAALMITVDTGITNVKEVRLAQKAGIDVIVTDHHRPLPTLPRAKAVVHTTLLSGSGVAWILANQLNPQAAVSSLDLLALATIGDLVPLTGPNRSFVYHGLKSLNQTSRPGLKTLIAKSGLLNRELGLYEIGHIIVPRLNAAGRLQHPIDSLRLICTSNPTKASQIADHLASLNQERQQLTEAALNQARSMMADTELPSLIFVASEHFHEGVIGLIAGRLVEEFSRPAVVVAKGKQISKASARSIPGFNLSEAFKTLDEHLIDGGGHPLAGGFTIESKKLDFIQQQLLNLANQLDDQQLRPTLDIDLELVLTDLTWELLTKINTLKPFGMGNPAPVFCLSSVPVHQVRWVGKKNQHLKLTIPPALAAIGFYMRDQVSEEPGSQLHQLAFTLEEDLWRGNHSLLLNIKDLRI